jgi:uncharacterized protein (UPF0332 family)
MAKAQSNLKVAVWAYDEGEYDPCVSRAYYAVFHAAIAALVKLTDYRPKISQNRPVWDHEKVPAELNRRLVHERKLFQAEIGSIPQQLILRRHEADYYEDRISRKVAQRCLEKAKRFVEAINKEL